MKPVKRVDTSKLTIEQRAALSQFIRDMKRAEPEINEMRRVAQEVFKRWVDSPTWSIVDGTKPEGDAPPEGWNVGAPKVTYVDHIEGEPQS